MKTCKQDRTSLLAWKFRIMPAKYNDCENFNDHDSSKACRSCQTRYSKQHYKKNLANYKYRDASRRRFIRNVVLEIKKSSSCERCGFSNYLALQFHHKDPSNKRFSISNAARDCGEINKVLEEINKCEVLCANCHAIHHNG